MGSPFPPERANLLWCWMSLKTLYLQHHCLPGKEMQVLLNIKIASARSFIIVENAKQGPAACWIACSAFCLFFFLNPSL